MRLSFNIARISRLLRLIRMSSNSGIIHSRSTIIVCNKRKILVNLSRSISRPSSWSFTASSMALSLSASRVLVRLSILNKDNEIPWSQTLQFQTRKNGFLDNNSHSNIPRQVVGVLIVQNLTCVSRTYSQPQPVTQVNLHTSLRLSPGKLSEFSLVQTPLLCLQDLLPTSACRDILKHIKNVSSQANNWQVTFIKWPYSQHAHRKWNKNTCHLNQEYSSSSMPFALQQQCTNLVITSEP